MFNILRNIVIVTFVTCFISSVGIQPVFAEAKYSLKEVTPEVQSALEARRDRYEELRKFKDEGVIGENNHGYADALTSNERAEALAKEENKDREIIYKAIIQQNNLTGAMDTIEKVFAQVQRDKALPGDKLQDEEGVWGVK